MSAVITETESRDRVAMRSAICERCSRTDIDSKQAYHVHLDYDWSKHSFVVVEKHPCFVCSECWDELVPQTDSAVQVWRGFAESLPIHCTDNGCGHWWGTIYFAGRVTPL